VVSGQLPVKTPGKQARWIAAGHAQLIADR